MSKAKELIEKVTESTEDDEAQEAATGRKFAEILMLKKKRSNGRYDTSWGDKTDIGIYRTIMRMAQEGHNVKS